VRPGMDVVIVTRDRRDLVLRCLRALSSAANACDVPVRPVVVDNGSHDATAEAVRRRHPEVRLVQGDERAGYGAACNRGAAAGDSELVLFLNNDVFAAPEALRRLKRALLDASDRVVAGGRLVDVGTDRAQVGFAVRSYPTLAYQIALMLGLERLWRGNPFSRRAILLDFDYGRTQLVEAAPAGACLLFRRTAFERLGGFDEGFPFWFEDTDLLARARQLGAVVYAHDAAFHHVGGATWRSLSRPDVVVRRYTGLLRYFAKHSSRRDELALRVVVGVLAGLRAWLRAARRVPAGPPGDDCRSGRPVSLLKPTS
jgi:N-acetylglucosaminyl-diphospho-decaprenol L-rhamnosyltransferase